MINQYEKIRYADERGYRILHIKGTHADSSTTPYLHYCSDPMLIWFISGSGSIKVEGKRYRINEGDLVLLNPTELFRISVEGEGYHERMTVLISESLFLSYPEAMKQLFAPIKEREKGIGNLIPAETVKKFGLDETLGKLLEHTCSDKSFAQLLVFCGIAELLTGIGEAKAGETQEQGQAISNPLIGEVLEYLNLHVTEDFEISDVAEEFNIDKSYLSHLFKEHVGMSLWTYVVLRRLQKFNSLIVEHDSIEEAAFLAGFKNYSNFFRLYKKHMGVSPTEFKKQIRKSAKIVNTDTRLF